VELEEDQSSAGFITDCYLRSRSQMRKKPITLWMFRRLMNQCWKRSDSAKGMRVLFYYQGKEVYLDRIGQFQVIPDVTIHLKKNP